MRTIRVSQFHGLPVLDSFHAMQAGVVDSVVVDTAAGRVVAIDVGHGDGLLVSRVPVEHLDRLGPSLVLMPDANAIPFIEPESWDSCCVSSRDLLGMEILNEEGDRIGRIADAHVDLRTLAVRHYELAAPFWQTILHPSRLWPSEIVSCSEEIMIVRRAAEKTAERKPLPLRLPAARGLREVA